jgi:hypothetical protein
MDTHVTLVNSPNGFKMMNNIKTKGLIGNYI